VANFRSHASFLTANLSTPFSGSFRTHFVVFSKRDCLVANLSVCSDVVKAFPNRRTLLATGSQKYSTFAEQQGDQDTNEVIIRQTRFAAACQSIGDFGL
jgi:hypothetical protein